jgi:hypothetical protein
LAILSIAALVGVFTVQVADAQVQVGPRGVIVQTEVFGLTADRSDLEMGSADARLPSIAVNEVDPSGVLLDPR